VVRVFQKERGVTCKLHTRQVVGANTGWVKVKDGLQPMQVVAILIDNVGGRKICNLVG